MASTLKAERFTNTITGYAEAYQAPGTSPSTSPATHKSTLLTGLRVVNSDSSNVDHTYSIKIVDSDTTDFVLMNDDVIQAKTGRDLVPGGTTMVLNQGDRIFLKADAASAVTLHIDVIERDA